MRRVSRGGYRSRMRRSPGSPIGRFRREPRRSSLATGRRIPARLIVAGVIVVVTLIGYVGSTSVNPVTGKSQRVALTVEQEIALGLQALPQMIAQHGGQHPDAQAQALVDRVGFSLVDALGVDHPYEFEFHLLADDRMVNAFALPGGQIFITQALFGRLETEGQLAGVLGHEIGHVIERHGAQRLAKQKLTQGLVGATAVGSESAQAAQVAQAVGGLLNMKYGRGDELECDAWGVVLLPRAGYDPRALVGVMRILAESGGGSQPEFFSSHPNPDNRIGRIQQNIRAAFPDGVPGHLRP